MSVRQVLQAARRWGTRRPSNKRWTPGPQSESIFFWRAIRWLTFIGRLKPQRTRADRFAPLLKAFDDYMLEERGLSVVRQHDRRRLLSQFLSHLIPVGDSLDGLTADALGAAFDGFVQSHGYARISIRTIATSLRCFFRWAEAQHWCAGGLTAAICGPRVYSLAALPAPPSWDDVKRLLALTEGDDPRSIRDRAILMLFSVYGLRQSEVTHLRLADFDWKTERLSVACSKTRKTRIFPLTRTVGDAVLRYLREARPRSDRREVFLSLRAPFGPLQVLWHTVGRHLGQLNVATPHSGPHILRHACATHLLKLVQAAKAPRRHWSRIESETLWLALVTLYATGMRLSELVNLNRADVNLSDALITVHRGKFGKTRLVPIGASLKKALRAYRDRRAAMPADGPFFTTRTGSQIKIGILQRNHRKLCQRARITRTGGGRFQPRLHDLRHTFAVHRLVAWYRKGADVQKLLPQLSMYMGHVCLQATQVYLTMTPELLGQAGRRFEHYATKEYLHV